MMLILRHFIDTCSDKGYLGGSGADPILTHGGDFHLENLSGFVVGFQVTIECCLMMMMMTTTMILIYAVDVSYRCELFLIEIVFWRNSNEMRPVGIEKKYVND